MGARKQEENAEEQAFLEPSAPHEDAAWSREKDAQDLRVTRYLRLALEIVMAIMIIILLVNPVYEQIEVKRTPVPTFPRKTYTFLPNSTYVRDDMLFDEHDTLHALHEWIPFSSDARGYVQVADYDSYKALGKPYTVPINRTSDGPAYMMSVFHQLHCLSYIVSHYQQGYAGVELTDDVAHHSAHCFDYLRQSIMCAADTNLEGETDAGPGWGSDHVCADYGAVLTWANEHAAMRWRSGLLPGEAIL